MNGNHGESLKASTYHCILKLGLEKPPELSVECSDVHLQMGVACQAAQLFYALFGERIQVNSDPKCR
jgi:hypothetical protein